MGFLARLSRVVPLLIVMAVSIGLLGIVAGFLRGYPDGEAIPFHVGTRFAYFALTVALAIIAIALTVGKRRHLMPVGLFLILELLSCFALICYAALPGMLDVGAVFTTTLNALMVGLAWYIIIAFMSRTTTLLPVGSCGWALAPSCAPPSSSPPASSTTRRLPSR